MDLKSFYFNDDEKPLDRAITDGGFCGIFRTVGFVGDSLSSGEFEGTGENGEKTYHDFFDYSWGQYMARAAGFKAYNFSRGGMTAKEYCESFAAANDFWNPDMACQAYVIALGVNDISAMLRKDIELGSIDDIDESDCEKNKPTFAGYYAKIIMRLKKIQPDAKFFFMTIPHDDAPSDRRAFRDSHAKLLYELAEYFSNSYVIDLRKYGPTYDAELKKQLFLGGHMNACGYIFTAQLTLSYIDFIIRHNMRDFRQIGFVGTPFRNTVD